MIFTGERPEREGRADEPHESCQEPYLLAIKYLLEHAVDDVDAHRHDIKQVYRGYLAPACKLQRMVQEAPESV